MASISILYITLYRGLLPILRSDCLRNWVYYERDYGCEKTSKHENIQFTNLDRTFEIFQVGTFIQIYRIDYKYI